MKHLKIILTAIVIALSLLLNSYHLSQASYVEDIPDFWSKASQSINKPDNIDNIVWSGGFVQSIQFHLLCAITGYPNSQGIITQQAYNNSALGKLTDVTYSLYSQNPISSLDYLAYLKTKFDITKPIYAQGEGNIFLKSATIEFWKLFRNLTYLFFVIIFVAIGLMIMFRKKMNAQTVMSVQSALPTIIIALIIITFSYAICGFLMDLGFLIQKLLQSAIIDKIPMTECLVSDPTLLKSTIRSGAACDPGMRTVAIQDVNPFNLMGKFIGGAWSGSISISLTSIGLNLIFTIIVLTSVFRIFLTLLSKYVTIITSTIFSPLILLWGSLPGQSDHLSRWLRSLFSAILCFPVMYLLVNFAYYFVLNANNIDLRELLPFNLKFLPTGSSDSATYSGGTLLGIGIILMLANVPKMIDDALAVKGGGGEEGVGAGVGGALRRLPGIGAFLG